MSLAIKAATTAGVQVVLANGITDEQGRVIRAQCAHPGCPVSLQRSMTGDLLDGVRAHYRTVHPERKVQ